MRKLVWMILGLVIISMCFGGCNSDQNTINNEVVEKIESEEHVDFIVQEGIKKIGIISVWSDVDNHQYAYKEEIFITDEQSIKDVVTVINDGEIDRTIRVDRLPAEYEIQIYYKDETLKCYYWYNETKYNFSISAIDGEITINGTVMDTMLQLITGETDRGKLVSPY